MPLEEDKEAMQQLPQPNYQEMLILINSMAKQIDRLERRVDERTNDIATQSGLDTLRKELVAQRELDPQMNALRTQVIRVDTDRVADKAFLENRINRLEQDQIGRQDRLWIRLGQIISVAAFALALFELLSHVKWLP